MVLTKEQEFILDSVREFAQKKVAPIAQEIDKTERFPAEIFQEFADMGYMGLCVPEEYDGGGMDEVTKALVIMELAKVCASTGFIVAVHYLFCDILMVKGTPEQKEKYLPQVCEGKIGGFALTEPNAGSDAAAARTKAVKDGSDYVLNGTKCFISNAGQDMGDFFVVIALTEPEKKTKGMTAFLVERNTPGFSIGKTEDKMGLRASRTSELILEDVRVPECNIIGKLGEGFKIAMAALDGGRIGIASQAVGICEGALEAAVKYSYQREQFGKPVGANQGLQWYIAEMATRTEAAKALTLEAAEVRMNGGDCSKHAAMAKFFASEAACFVVDLSLQIHGGYGYMKEYPIERMYRDARITRIYEGTNEVQKMVISRIVMNELK